MTALTKNAGCRDFVAEASTEEIAAALDDYREIRPRPKNGLTWSLYEQVGTLCRNREPDVSKARAVFEGLPNVSEKSARKYVRNAERLGIDCGPD